MLFIAESPGRGRGVFSDRLLEQGELIESCPVIILTKEDRPRIDETSLFDYYFNWGADSKDAAIALGYGSLYNHSFSPNAFYRANLENKTLEFVSLKQINANEEILVNYNGKPESQKLLWKSDQINWIE